MCGKSPMGGENFMQIPLPQRVIDEINRRDEERKQQRLSRLNYDLLTGRVFAFGKPVW